MSIKYIDLFAGVGGFHYGIEKVCKTSNDLGNSSNNRRKLLQRIQPSEATCVYSNEYDKYANSVYKKHYERCDDRDIRTVKTEEIPDHDLLVGGFPCQAFSVAGKRRGFEDTRGTLFFEIARIAKQKQPRLLLLENVKGLLSHDSGNTFKTILRSLDELGYDCQWQVLNSKDFSVPQNRERVFIIGHLRGTSRPEVFPIRGSNSNHLEEITKGVSDAQRIYSTKQAKSLKGLGGGLGAKTGLYKIDNLKIRRLTPVECERLQGFPDNWTKYGHDDKEMSDTQRYKMMGNAVTTNVVTSIVRKLI